MYFVFELINYEFCVRVYTSTCVEFEYHVFHHKFKLDISTCYFLSHTFETRNSLKTRIDVLKNCNEIKIILTQKFSQHTTSCTPERERE